MTNKKLPSFVDKKVKAVFDEYPKDLRKKLDRMREMIFEVASETEGVGNLDETLKWGSPSYLTNESQSGTTVRIDRISWQKEKYGIFVHCQSGVMEQFKSAFGNEYEYDGKRGIILDTKDEIPEEAVRHFIWLALTYHLRKKRKPRSFI